MSDESTLFHDHEVTAVLLPDGWHTVSVATFRPDHDWPGGVGFRFLNIDTDAWMRGPWSAVQAVQYGNHPSPGRKVEQILDGLSAWAALQPRVSIDWPAE